MLDIHPTTESEHKISPADGIRKIWSVNEWGRLREVIIGSPQKAFTPDLTDISWRNFDRADEAELHLAVAGQMPSWIIEETLEDIEGLARVLSDLGVMVHFAGHYDFGVTIRSPLWEVQQESGINIRDLTLIHGNVVMEAPSPTRGRYFEYFVVRDLFDAYRKQDSATWFVAPHRPRLRDETYDLLKDRGIEETEPLFDAANAIRLGRDIIIDINNTANRSGVQWIRQTLSKHYGEGVIRIHDVQYSPDHIDVVVVPLAEGCFLLNPLYVSRDTLPENFRNWDVLYAPEMAPQTYSLGTPKATNWIGMNALVIDAEERTVIVEKRQTALIRLFEENNFRPIPVQWRHGRNWGGAFHCVTLDVHRDGEL